MPLEVHRSTPTRYLAIAGRRRGTFQGPHTGGTYCGDMSTLLRWIIRCALVLVGAAGMVAVSLIVTPMQEVSTAGQTIRVGVTSPSWSLSGPGQVDLFGQTLPTVIEFAGPIRPRLELTHITLSEQLAQFAAAGSGAAQALQQTLINGWTHFFIWQLIIALALAVVAFGAVAGWLRQNWRRTVGLIVAGALVTGAIDAGVVMVTAYTAPTKLAQVTSLQALVGARPLPTLPGTVRDPSEPIRSVVVIGDSTAAGLGNPPLADPGPADTACKRSRFAFAVNLERANNWDVTNLACSGATIRSGLLGPQHVGGMTLPPQLADPVVADADLLIVSIGANDVHWSTILKLCAVSTDCANSAELAYVQQQLDSFSADMLQLAAALQQLQNHPAVIINEYYDPFADDITCLADHGLTADKHDALDADLAALNTILASSAKAAGFTTATPDFAGHGVCSSYPYVQGLDDPAPFHPTAAGQLAIALADSHALHTPIGEVADRG